MTFETLTPELFRAALGLSGLSLSEFSEKTGLSKSKLSKFQNALGVTFSEKSVKTIRQFFNNRGIEIGANGVSFILGVQELYGSDGFRQLYDQIYEAVKDGGDIRVYHGVSQQFISVLGEDYVAMHVKRMSAIADKIHSRTIVKDGDEVFFGRNYSHYRSMAPEHFSERTMIIFENNVAFINLCGKETYIQLNRSKEMADMCGRLFDLAWEHQAKEIPHDKYDKT